jgi:hypothetical protein
MFCRKSVTNSPKRSLNCHTQKETKKGKIFTPTDKTRLACTQKQKQHKSNTKATQKQTVATEATETEATQKQRQDVFLSCFRERHSARKLSILSSITPAHFAFTK